MNAPDMVTLYGRNYSKHHSASAPYSIYKAGYFKSIGHGDVSKVGYFFDIPASFCRCSTVSTTLTPCGRTTSQSLRIP